MADLAGFYTGILFVVVFLVYLDYLDYLDQLNDVIVLIFQLGDFFTLKNQSFDQLSYN